VLSLVIGLSCHHPRCDAGMSGPKGRHRHSIIGRLNVSVETSGPHDFAVRRRVVRLFDTTASIASRANES
jgi:hypothetical protein